MSIEGMENGEQPKQVAESAVSPRHTGVCVCVCGACMCVCVCVDFDLFADIFVRYCDTLIVAQSQRQRWVSWKEYCHCHSVREVRVRDRHKQENAQNVHSDRRLTTNVYCYYVIINEIFVKHGPLK